MDSGACPPGYEGGFAVDDQFRATAVHLCFATSQCKGPGLCPAPWNPESGCRNLRDAMLGGLNKIDSEGVANPTNHIFELKCDPEAGCFVVTAGYVDAWGRRYGANVWPPTSRSYLNDWLYYGSCNPAAIQACPEPNPTPRPSVSPTPEPSVSPVAGCPKPDDVSMAENQPQPKERGFRNTFDASPWYQGQKIRPESGCGDYLLATYGEFQRFVSGTGISGRDPLELNSGNPYQVVDATNSDDEHWVDGKYTLAGSRQYCISYNHLDHYKCIDCTMTSAGKVTGCGDRYDLAK